MTASSRSLAPRPTAALICLATTAIAALAILWPARAEALHDPCPAAFSQVSQAVSELTGGIQASGPICLYPYGGRYYSGYDQLKETIRQEVVDRCGSTPEQRNLAMAVFELTRYRPEPGTAVCNRAIYDQRVAAQGGCGNNGTTNWTWYKTINNTNNVGEVGHQACTAFRTVINTLDKCTDPRITVAVLEATGSLPRTAQDDPAMSVSGDINLSGTQATGHCYRGWYHRGEFNTVEEARNWAVARQSSTATCSPSTQVADWYRTIGAGWRPMDDNWGTDGHECDTIRYLGTIGTDVSEWNKALVYAAQICHNPWIGQLYYADVHRRPRGSGNTGECNPTLYGATTPPNPRLGPVNSPGDAYRELAGEIAALQNTLTQRNARFSDAGGQFIVNGTSYPGDSVLMVNKAGDVARPQGTFLRESAVAFASASASHVIAVGAGNVIAVGAGNFSVGAGDSQPPTVESPLIGVGAGNAIVSQANVIAVGAGNLIGVGAGNLIGVGAGNVIAVGAGNFSIAELAQQFSIDASLIGVGAGNLISDNGSGIINLSDGFLPAGEAVPAAYSKAY